MKIFVLLAVAGMVLAMTSSASAEESAGAGDGPDAESSGTRVEFETTKGKFVVELVADKAPQTVESFLDNVTSGFYDGTIFHRVIPGFMVQGGGFDPDLKQKPTAKALTNEADNGLSNQRGTIAMARKNTPHSASTQFFVNVAANPALDHRSKASGATWGYTVFGRVVEGMEVIDSIVAVETTRRGMHGDVPTQPIVILAARVLEPS